MSFFQVAHGHSDQSVWVAVVKKKNRGKKESIEILAQEQKTGFSLCLFDHQDNTKIFMSI